MANFVFQHVFFVSVSLALLCFQELFVSSAALATDMEATAKPVAGHRHTVPLHRQRVPVKSDDGRVSFKSVYFGSIALGVPKQHFSVVFDTGSGHVIVPSTLCESDTCTMHNRYDVHNSETSQEVDSDGTPVAPGAPRDQVTVAFGTGEVTGQFANERICMGAVSTPATLASNVSESAEQDSECVDMRVVMASEMTEEPFASFTFDGVLGLGLDGLALAPEFSFFGMMAKHGNLASPSFGVFLADSTDDFSEISFGGHNPIRVRSELSWSPVPSPELGYWQVKILAVRVGNKSMDFCDDGQCRAVVDTGTSLIAIPGDLFAPVQEELEESLQDPKPEVDGVVDCRNAAGHVLEFDVEGGATLTLSPGDYARPSIQMADGEDDEAALAATSALNGEGHGDSEVTQQAKCHPTLMPIDMPEPLGPKLFILGEPVLRKYYTTYDWGNKRIGFGLAVHATAYEDIEQDEDAAEDGQHTPLLML